MDGRTVSSSSPAYPQRLNALLGALAPESVSFAGNETLLQCRTIALFCSRQCPGAMILQTYDFMQRLRHRDIALIGGFHSPMEKECLRALMAGTAGVVWCLGKSLASFRMPPEFAPLLDKGRLLVLSPFPAAVTRITAETALYRNRVNAALADEVFLPHAAAGSATEAFCLEILSWEKPVFTLDAEDNRGILDRGAQAVQLRDIDSLWPEKRTETPEDCLV